MTLCLPPQGPSPRPWRPFLEMRGGSQAGTNTPASWVCLFPGLFPASRSAWSSDSALSGWQRSSPASLPAACSKGARVPERMREALEMPSPHSTNRTVRSHKRSARPRRSHELWQCVVDTRSGWAVVQRGAGVSGAPRPGPGVVVAAPALPRGTRRPAGPLGTQILQLSPHSECRACGVTRDPRPCRARVRSQLSTRCPTRCAAWACVPSVARVQSPCARTDCGHGLGACTCRRPPGAPCAPAGHPRDTAAAPAGHGGGQGRSVGRVCPGATTCHGRWRWAAGVWAHTGQSTPAQ